MTVTCIVEWIRLTGTKNIKENIVESIERMKKHPVLKFVIPSLTVISVDMIIANLLFWIIDLRNLGILMRPFDITGSLVFIGGGFMVCRGISRYFIKISDRNDLRYLPRMAIECYYLVLLALFFQLSFFQMLLLDQALMNEINGITLFEMFMTLSDDHYFFVGFLALILLMAFYSLSDILDRSSEREELQKEIERELKEKTFKINEYLELKLIHNDTIIFIKGEKFLQCKSLMLNISTEEIPEYDEINSIDEAERLNLFKNPHGTYKFNILPEEEFWGHCSNLQTWYENKYDPRLLHSNLAMPLLRALTNAGDPLAKIILKEEIIRQLETGTLKVDTWVRLFLEDMSLFTAEEIKDLDLLTSDKLSLIREKAFGDFREFREEEEDENDE